MESDPYLALAADSRRFGNVHRPVKQTEVLAKAVYQAGLWRKHWVSIFFYDGKFSFSFSRGNNLYMIELLFRDTGYIVNRITGML